MKSLIRLSDYTKEEIFEIFNISDDIQLGKYEGCLLGKTIVLFFPSSSIRTRVTFEKGINMLGGQVILFPSDALDKKEEIKDVVGYLNNWVDCIIARHSNIELINEMVAYSDVPVINAMTSVNHPCEVLSDLYGLSKLRKNFLDLNYLFVGANENIGLAWREVSKVFNFSFTQCCPHGYEMENIYIEHNIKKAFLDKDIILTDSLGKENLRHFNKYQVTTELMNLARENALLNPCPPFHRGEEVSRDVIDSKYFIGYDFKKSLLNVQQAIIIFNMQNP